MAISIPATTKLNTRAVRNESVVAELASLGSLENERRRRE
jgi:hypothetical protein